jgi:hypothetical protein
MIDKIKAIADRYKIKKNLFKVNSYLYARCNIFHNLVFDKYTLDTVFGCVVNILDDLVCLRKLRTRANTKDVARKVF